VSRIVATDSLWGAAKRPTPDSVDDLLVYCALGVIVGGRLGNVLFYDPSYYLARPLEIFEVWHGGMAFHGGLIGAALGAWLFARRYAFVRQAFGWLLDRWRLRRPTTSVD
jgi:phosphatidylglycerol:prolipoprotein diacylglycerol transferase